MGPSHSSWKAWEPIKPLDNLVYLAFARYATVIEEYSPCGERTGEFDVVSN